jgi:DnaJ-class molecular chaperone
MAAKAAVAPKVVVTDRRKHYEILGIKPRLELISAESADKVNDELKAVLYALTRRHHPDLASSPADEDARHNRMSKINVAYAHVETLALRRHYHDPFVFPNPNKK